MLLKIISGIFVDVIFLFKIKEFVFYKIVNFEMIIKVLYYEIGDKIKL